MVVFRMVTSAIKMALEHMNKEYCSLSQIDYSRIEVEEPIKEIMASMKYLERPFAYEFYHQLRKLIDNGKVDFGGSVIQAEVDKRYQHCFSDGKMPDFIIHVPNTDQNLAVIEFKLADNLYKLEEDLAKLVEFKENPKLQYSHLIEVIIGPKDSLETAKALIGTLCKSEGKEIVIIEFDTDSWKANDTRILY